MVRVRDVQFACTDAIGDGLRFQFRLGQIGEGFADSLTAEVIGDGVCHAAVAWCAVDLDADIAPFDGDGPPAFAYGANIVSKPSGRKAQLRHSPSI